ncbi:hypothetical protein ADUPG1_009755, partial [Aduncisulcus paluster]
SLHLSDNSISDVSVLITEDIFPAGTLTTLDISGNNICDIDGMVSELQAKFTALSSVTYSDQTCHCSASVSSADHQVCREVYPGRWAVECWHGYYLDKASGSCVAACASGYVYDTASATCVSSSSAVDDAIRCQVCEGHSTMMPVLEEGNSSITCGCRSAWYGDDCDSYEFQLYIPDDNFRTFVCEAADYAEGTLCDISEFEMAGISGEFSLPTDDPVSSIEGAQYLINLDMFEFDNSPVSYSSPLASLSQLNYVNWRDSSLSAEMRKDLEDFTSLYSHHRYWKGYCFGDANRFDISIIFKNIGIKTFDLANNNQSLYNPICRSEDDTEFWTFISAVFPILNANEPTHDIYYLPNNCPLNDDPGNTPYYCDPGTEDQCPSIVLNEVYNSLDGVDSKECAFIAKEGDNGECYTVHDDEIRAYLSESTNGCLAAGAAESNGIISVATLRRGLLCSSLDLSAIVAYGSISDVNEITTLQGLEYAQGTLSSGGGMVGLTSLNIDGYDISGDDSISEYDRLVVQILAKAVAFTYSDSETTHNLDSGLTLLSAANCGIYEIGSILDLTPDTSATEFYQVQPFKLTDINLSSNYISDVSILMTSEFFYRDSDSILTTLDISENQICDIANVSSTLTFSITSLSTLTISDQKPCACGINSLSSSAIAFSDHKTCRRRSDGYYQVECWNGYYLDKNTNTCVKACPSGYSLDVDGETCISDASVTEDNSVRCQVCECKDTFVSILINSYVTCGCSFGFYGDSCEYVDIPDSNLRSSICESVVPKRTSDCGDLTISELETITSLSASNVDTFEGLQYAINLTDLVISGVSSNSIGNDELSFLPLSLVNLNLYNVDLEDGSDFSVFSSLDTLSVVDNTSFTISSSDVFPSLLQSLDISGCTSITDLSFLPTSLVNLSIEGLSISESSLLADFTVLETLNASSTGLTDWDLFSLVGLSSLTTLLLSNNSLTDISLLYQLDSLVTLDVTDNKLCNVNNSAFDTFFSNATVTVGSDTDFD